MINLTMKVIFNILLIVVISESQKLMPQNSLRKSVYKTNQRCINPNQHSGTCVEVWHCQVLLHSDTKFIEASQCGGGYGHTPYVCCSSDTGFIQVKSFYDEFSSISEEDSEEDDVYNNKLLPHYIRGRMPINKPSLVQTNSMNLLPQPPTCGGELIDRRIYGGTNTDIYEFPWMAFLEYSQSDSRKEAICAGSLINNRYILTAGHCVQGQVIKQKGELIAARLGVHDYNKAFPYADNINRLRIVEKIVHENYRSGKTPINDLALLRLESNVLYSKTIRPICLPSVLKPYSLKPTTELTVVGWGATENSSSNTIKRKVTVPIVNQTLCIEKFAKFGLNIQTSQLCAGGELNKDSCRGDSGAPLMHYRYGVWVLEGIVSFGRRCGNRDWPGVYTRITTYTKWITEKLKP